MELFDEVQDHQPTPMEQGYSILTTFLFLITFMVMGNLLGAGCLYLLELGYGISFKDLLFESGRPQDSLKERNFVRWASLITHFMTFTLPALATIIFLEKKQWAVALQLNKVPRNYNIFLAILFVFCSFPLAQLGLWLNQQIPLPEWAINAESNSEHLLGILLKMDSPIELFFNFFVIAMIPALGEELVFRGLIQEKLAKVFKSPWMAIWVTAIIFSAFHLQFAGFIPRLILGGILGYIFHWTKNLWLPIIAHAFLNGIQLLASYGNISNGDLAENQLGSTIQQYWPIFVLAGLLTIGTAYLLDRYNDQRFTTIPPNQQP